MQGASRTAAGRLSPLLAVACALFLLCGCSSSKENCNDVSGNVCDRLEECGRLAPAFLSNQECVVSLDGLWELTNRTDAACRAEWDQVRTVTCDQLVAHYNL